MEKPHWSKLIKDLNKVDDKSFKDFNEKLRNPDEFIKDKELGIWNTSKGVIIMKKTPLGYDYITAQTLDKKWIETLYNISNLKQVELDDKSEE